MAWEKLTLSRRNSVVALVALSAIWIAVVIAGARLTNFDEPYLPFALAGALIFFLRGAPSRWEIYAWLSISVAFVKIIHLSPIPFWVLRVASGFAVLGFGAIVLLGLRAVWSEREGRENALALLLPSLVLVFFIFVSGNVLRLSGGLNPQTDDAWLYAFDGSLGFQPSFFYGKNHVQQHRPDSVRDVDLPLVAFCHGGRMRGANTAWRKKKLLAGPDCAVAGWRRRLALI